MNKIKNVRLNLDLTQTQFAKLLNISKQSIWLWENELHKPLRYDAIVINVLDSLLNTSSSNDTKNVIRGYINQILNTTEPEERLIKLICFVAANKMILDKLSKSVLDNLSKNEG